MAVLRADGGAGGGGGGGQKRGAGGGTGGGGVTASPAKGSIRSILGLAVKTTAPDKTRTVTFWRWHQVPLIRKPQFENKNKKGPSVLRECINRKHDKYAAP